MKKALLLSLIFIMTTAFFYTGAPIAREKYRLKMVVHLLYSDTSEYFYNPDGHISKVRNSKGNDINYTYLRGKVIRTYFDNLRKFSFSDTLVLNDKGLAVKLTSNNPGFITELREFNAAGCLTRSRLIDKNGSEKERSTYDYTDGDQISALMTNDSGINISKITYQYYKDQANTIGAENLGSGFTGTDSKNPVKYSRCQVIGLQPFNCLYHYHYDDKGRIIIKAAYEIITGKLLDSTAYVYYSGVKIVPEGK